MTIRSPDRSSVAACRLKTLVNAVTVLCLAGCAVLPPVTVRDGDGMTARAQSPEQIPVAADESEREPYLALTLRDAVELALEHSDVILVLSGGVRLTSQTTFDALIDAWEVAAQEGRFQPSIIANFEGSQVNEPPNAFFGPGISARTRRDTFDMRGRLSQPLRTGGEVSVGIEPPLAYLYFPEGVDPGEFNPTWSADFVFRFRQPLMRGGGYSIATAPIRIAQLQTNQTQWQVQEQINNLIRSVAEAYWELYAANVELYSVQSIIPLAAESVRVEKLRLQAELTIYPDLARAEYQLGELRRQEARAAAEVRRRELQLRQLIGAPAELRPVLYAADAPVQAAPENDAERVIQEALFQRPELNGLREQVGQRAVELDVATNNVLPQVDLKAEYRAAGLEKSLDDSLRQAGDFDYTDWTLGVDLTVPLGNLTANSRERAAELRLTRDRIRLQRLEQNVAFEISEIHSDLRAAWEQYIITSRQAAQTQEWLRLSRIRYEEPPAAGSDRNWLLVELADFQKALDSWLNAVSSSGNAIARYNTLLAELDAASGMAFQRWTAPAVEPLPESSVWPASSAARYGHSLLLDEVPQLPDPFPMHDESREHSQQPPVTPGHAFPPPDDSIPVGHR